MSDLQKMHITPTRAAAYRAALAKTAGRAFTFDGALVLTDDERELLRRMEALDFADAFQRAIAVRVAMMRLDLIVSGRPA